MTARIPLILSLLALAACGKEPSAAAPPPATSPNVAAPLASAPGATPPSKETAMKTYTKPSREALQASLTPEQFKVTCEAATEPPFRNAYWDNHAAGLYVDVTTGEPLFSSTDKFDSGSGWPSFTRPVQKDVVVEHSDRTYGMVRTEVRSKSGDAHLGHVFDDGPADKGGLRYCINSASLRFIPKERLEAEGYGEYKHLFDNAK